MADAGDGVDDANFVDSMADAGVLRLYNFLEWIREMVELKKCGGLRRGKVTSVVDRVFENEMNKKIKETEENYEKMLYKEAIRTGFFEYQVRQTSG